MKDLIEALTIFAKYSDKYNPTNCEHDVLVVVGIKQTDVSAEDRTRLGELGFFWSSDFDQWASFRFGSA